MPNYRSEFAKKIAPLKLTHAERAVSFLWFYRRTQQFDERSAGELADDLHEEGFPKPKVSALKSGLKRSKRVTTGKRAGTFQIDVRRLAELNAKYDPLVGEKSIDISGEVLPLAWVQGTRPYLEKLVYQIDASYEAGLYDACAVLCRRLMESLIIEIFISKGLHHEIKNNGVFLMLDGLISRVRNHKSIVLARNSSKTMDVIKQTGDTAAHDRTYITPRQDIDEWKSAYRRLIQDLMTAASIAPTP